MTLSFLLACTALAPSDTAEADTVTALPSCDTVDATGWSEETHAKGVDGDYDLLFGDAVPRIDITLCDGDLDAMYADLDDLLGQMGGPGGPGGPGAGGPSSSDQDPIYVAAVVSHDGRTWPSVGMRFKGNSSLHQAWQQDVHKLPFRLHFDYWEDHVPEVDDQRFHGFKELKFNNGWNDASLVRDKLMADILLDQGVPASRGNFAEVWVDAGDGPVYWGLYTMYEDTCGEMLDRHFQDDDGRCYKADGPTATLTDFDSADFEDKTHDGSGDDVAAMVEVLNSGAGASWRQELEQHIDVDGWLKALAINTIGGNWDTYGQMTHNYYLYADPNQGRLVYVPWDFGLSWHANTVREPNSLYLDEIGDDWPLIRRVLDDATYRAAYDAHVDDLLAGPMASDTILDRAEELQDRIRDLALAEQAPFTTGHVDFDRALYDSRDAIADWATAIEQ